MNQLKERLSKIKPGRILDIGTGSGSFVAMMTAVYKDYEEIIGIDQIERAIEAANKHFDDEKISFEVMDIHDMSFPPHSFDMVTLSNSLHHMPDMTATLDRMLDMVKPGGVLLFNEMYCDNLSEAQLTHTYLHHFWAEIDRATGVIHNETMKRQDIIDTIQGHPAIATVEAWDMDFGERPEMTQDQKDWLKKSLDDSLKKVQDHEDYEAFKQKAKSLQERIDQVGFDSATQLMTLARI